MNNILLAFIISYVFNSEASTTFAFLKLRDDKRILLFGLSKTNNDLLSNNSKLAKALE